MPDRRDEIKKELAALVKQAEGFLWLAMAKHLAEDPVERKKLVEKFDEKTVKQAEKFEISAKYQTWYSKALRVIEQLLPDRYDEFRARYQPDRPPKELDLTSYTISHYLAGVVVTRGFDPAFDPFTRFRHHFEEQINILRSATDRIDSLLADIKGTLEAQVFDDELEAAGELRKKKHLRAAGVVTGVVLERHLKRVAVNHKIAVRKKSPTISTLNDLLKTEGIYDTIRWREIQRLGDIRNLAGHDREREPSDVEIGELISGVDRVIKTLF